MSEVLPEADHPEDAADAANRRRLGLAVRADVIRALTSAKLSATLHALSCGVAGLAVGDVLSCEVASAVLADLERETGWSEECWILDENADVKPVMISDFETAPPTRRFSRNECLRKPAAHAYSLRGFLSAIVSNEVRAGLSSAFGENVRFRSADMARYRIGHYLRRHSDAFESRRFGIVWFFSPGWSPSMGGELVIESPAGEVTVITPTQRSIGVLAIRPDCFHQVARVCAVEWVRYSIASHFCADDGT